MKELIIIGGLLYGVMIVAIVVTAIRRVNKFRKKFYSV